MQISRRFSKYFIWIIVAALIASSVVSYFIQGTGYETILNRITLIILIASGLIILVTTSIYGILENKFGKEGSEALPAKTVNNYNLINTIFSSAVTISTICIFILLSLMAPYYPLVLLVPPLFFLGLKIIHKKVFK